MYFGNLNLTFLWASTIKVVRTLMHFLWIIDDMIKVYMHISLRLSDQRGLQTPLFTCMVFENGIRKIDILIVQLILKKFQKEIKGVCKKKRLPIREKEKEREKRNSVWEKETEI